MELSSPPLDAVPDTNRPLRIVVSEAGQTAALKALVAQSLPMLRSPEGFPAERRRDLAKRLERAIGARADTVESPAFDGNSELVSNEEPGDWLEDDQ